MSLLHVVHYFNPVKDKDNLPNPKGSSLNSSKIKTTNKAVLEVAKKPAST